MNGVHFNADAPPPSTLAAQIVQNQTRPDIPLTDGETPTFAQLLHEILNNPGEVQETDLKTNVALVSVVAEAGLAPLARDDPFAQFDVLIPQAKDSIAVIEKTIERQPEVLFTSTNDNGPQLALPLLVQLAALCGRPRCEELPISNLIECAVAALVSSSELWHYEKLFKQVCQDMVDGT